MSMTRHHTRRRLATMCLCATLPLAAIGGCSSSGDSDDGSVTLRFSWWGNNDRAETTQKVIDAFEQEHPDIKVEGETADFNSYFERLATQVASGDAPDVITLGGAYPREYGDRGALLDLDEVSDDLSTSGVDAAALASGEFSGTQYGVPTGVNAVTIMADPTVFETAGVPLPDEDSWTWQDLAEIGESIAANSPDGTYGLPDPIRTDILDLYARQRGESLYTEDGKLGISQETLTELWNYTLALSESGATPSASLTAELATQPAPEQSLIGRGLAGLQVDWSNQVTALRKSSGHELQLLRPPGESEDSPGLWLQASQLYSINSSSDHPQEAAQFIDYLVNNAEAGKLILTDRGIPANGEIREAIAPILTEDQSIQVDYIDRMADKMGPTLIIGPTGSTETQNILRRLNEEVLFDRMSPAGAAENFIQQVGAEIGG